LVRRIGSEASGFKFGKPRKNQTQISSGDGLS
jgi:hypothetical protein